MTFVVVLLGALFAVIPATAPLGLLLCLGASIPAVIALRQTRDAVASERRRAVASVTLAPVFLVVSIIVGATSTPSPPTGLLAGPPTTTGAAVPTLASVPPPPPSAPPSSPTVAASSVTAVQVEAPASPKRATTSTARPPVVPPPATARAASACDSSTHYVNSSGNCVPRPGTGGATATAMCKDGTPSYSQHRSGTCSGHGGVAQWLVNLP